MSFTSEKIIVDAYTQRQLCLLLEFIAEYRRALLGLHAFIQRVEGIRCAIDSTVWDDVLWPLSELMEITYGLALDRDEEPGVEQMGQIDEAISRVEGRVLASMG